MPLSLDYSIFDISNDTLKVDTDLIYYLGKADGKTISTIVRNNLV